MGYLRIRADFWMNQRCFGLTGGEYRKFMNLALYIASWPGYEISMPHARFLKCDKHLVAKFVAKELLIVDPSTGAFTLGEGFVVDGEGAKESPSVGSTYIVQAGEGGPVKIGHTRSSVESRVKTLQTSSAERLRIVHVLEGAHHEVVLHERFADWRIGGEWFDPCVLDLLGPIVAVEDDL